MTTSGRQPPKSLGDLLAQSQSLNNSRRISWNQWRMIVGTRIAQRSRPEFLDKDALTVKVASSTWAQELSFLTTTIIERLANHGWNIRTLRFRVGTVDTPRAKPVARKPRPVQLPEKLLNTLDRLDDPELRETIARAAAYSIAVNEK